jgi:hypothetical protein
MDQPIDVDLLFSRRPELFPHPVPTLEKRRSLFVGERVKIAVGVREREQLVYGRWLVVESISRSDSDLRALGRSWQPFEPVDACFTFGVENIYRMEPRRFYLWGAGGIPIAMRSGDGVDERIPARPLDSKEQSVAGCDEVILAFTALGSRSAESLYRKLASQHDAWPAYEALQ